MVTDYRRENERFVDKVNKLQSKLAHGDHFSLSPGEYPGSAAKYIEKGMESTTSYFTDEEMENRLTEEDVMAY